MERDGQRTERHCKDGDWRLNRSEDPDFFISPFDGEGRGAIVRG